MGRLERHKERVRQQEAVGEGSNHKRNKKLVQVRGKAACSISHSEEVGSEGLPRAPSGRSLKAKAVLTACATSPAKSQGGKKVKQNKTNQVVGREFPFPPSNRAAEMPEQQRAGAVWLLQVSAKKGWGSPCFHSLGTREESI